MVYLLLFPPLSFLHIIDYIRNLIQFRFLKKRIFQYILKRSIYAIVYNKIKRMNRAKNSKIKNVEFSENHIRNEFLYISWQNTTQISFTKIQEIFGFK